MKASAPLFTVRLKRVVMPELKKVEHLIIGERLTPLTDEHPLHGLISVPLPLEHDMHCVPLITWRIVR